MHKHASGLSTHAKMDISIYQGVCGRLSVFTRRVRMVVRPCCRGSLGTRRCPPCCRGPAASPADAYGTQTSACCQQYRSRHHCRQHPHRHGHPPLQLPPLPAQQRPTRRPCRPSYPRTARCVSCSPTRRKRHRRDSVRTTHHHTHHTHREDARVVCDVHVQVGMLTSRVARSRRRSLWWVWGRPCVCLRGVVS